MPLSKDLQAYSEEEHMLLLAALREKVTITFDLPEQLTAVRHRLYALKKAIAICPKQKKERLEKIYPLLQYQDEVAELTMVKVSLCSLSIGRHVASKNVASARDTIKQTLKGLNRATSFYELNKQQKQSLEEYKEINLTFEQKLENLDLDACIEQYNQDIYMDSFIAKAGTDMTYIPRAQSSHTRLLKALKKHNLTFDEVKDKIDHQEEITSPAAEPQPLEEYPDGAILQDDDFVLLPTGQLIHVAIYNEQKRLINSQSSGEDILLKKIEELTNK